MTTWAEIKPKPPQGQNATGGVHFELQGGGKFMSLATNQSGWNAVNTDTGDLKTMRDADPVILTE